MDIQKADVVLSKVGRDKGRLFFVFDIVDKNYALIADGKIRRVDKPKKKKLKHLSFSTNKDTAIRQKILNGEKICDVQLRKILNQFDIQ